MKKRLCIVLIFYNKYFSLVINFLRSKRLALKDTYLVLLNVCRDNNDAIAKRDVESQNQTLMVKFN